MLLPKADFLVFLALLVQQLIDISSGLLSDVGRENLIRQAAKYTGGELEEEEKLVSDYERRLLNMFSLSRRPTPAPGTQIPRIMQHLYRAHMGDTYEVQADLASAWEPGFDLPGDEVLSRVNTARSFHHIDADEHVADGSTNQIRLRFDLTALPSYEVVHAAELLIHRQEIRQHAEHDKSKSNRYRINVYEVTTNSSRSLGDATGSHVTRLIESRPIDVRSSTWERFDVSAATRRWAKGKHPANRGLVVEVVGDKDSTPPEGADARHVRLRRDLHSDVSDQEWDHQRPTLLTYTHDGKAASTSLSRRRRDASRKNRRRKKKKRLCRKRALYVDFKDVGWDSWIAAPHGYHAYYCDGKCNFPLSDNMNATNHAIVQSLAHAVLQQAVPRACCVPTQLDSISMLYLNEYDQVILKTYHDMVVQACGCR